MEITALASQRYAQAMEAFAARLEGIPNPSQTFSQILSSRLGLAQEQVTYTSNLPENIAPIESVQTAPVAQAAQVTAPSVPAELTLKRAQVDPYVRQAAAKYDLPQELIHGVIRAESSYNANSVSSVGAQGLMQLMPGTARSLGVSNSFDPAQNIDGGAKYLRQMLDRFDGDLRLALAAYNCGPSRVESLGITSSMDSASYAKLSTGVRTYVSRVLGYAGLSTV